jgi:hypothetical protein
MTHPEEPEQAAQQPPTAQQPEQPPLVEQPPPSVEQQPQQEPPQQSTQPPAGYPAQPPVGYPAYPMGPYWIPRPPSGGTAVTAGVFACLGAFWALIAAVINFSILSDAPDKAQWIVLLQAIAMVIELFTLLPGAILLFQRKLSGRILVAAGCVVHIVQGVISLIGIMSLGYRVSRHVGSFGIGSGAAGVLLAAAPAIATLVLVLVPLTRRWCEWREPLPQPQPQQWQGS